MKNKRSSNLMHSSMLSDTVKKTKNTNESLSQENPSSLLKSR